jgi:hypothetical protein
MQQEDPTVADNDRPLTRWKILLLLVRSVTPLDAFIAVCVTGCLVTLMAAPWGTAWWAGLVIDLLLLSAITVSWVLPIWAAIDDIAREESRRG